MSWLNYDDFAVDAVVVLVPYKLHWHLVTIGQKKNLASMV
jgi:hypothetical protein